MSVYHIFIVDPFRQLLPKNVWNDVKIQLNLLFDPVIGTAGGTFELALVVYSNNVVTPAPNELLVYIMPPNLSVVASAPTKFPVDLTADGNTAWRVGASEVYARNLDHPVLLAKIAFHECMHNKLRLGQSVPNGPDSLHDSQDGLGVKEFGEDAKLTSKNIKTMAKALNNPVPQWTAGIQMLLTGMHDPLSPFHQI
jgi:hypothetical protein